MNSVLYEPRMIYYETSTQPSPTEQLILSAKFSRTIQDLLYAIFFSYTFPSEYLSLAKFRLFIEKLDDANKSLFDMSGKVRNLFHSFDLTQRGVLSFSEFLLGLAALEPNTQHGGTPAEQRCRYIFRYYTYDPSGEETSVGGQSMSFEQFKALIYDINLMKKTPGLDDASLDLEAMNGFRQFGLAKTSDLLTLSDFLVGVGQLKFRGTSVLFRLNKSIVDLIELSDDSLIFHDNNLGKIKFVKSIFISFKRLIKKKTISI